MVSLKSKITRVLVTYFLLNDGVELYINEMARLFELDPKNTHKKLVDLERQGLLLSRFSGKQKYYRLNNDYPLLNELRTIFNSTIGLHDMIAQKFKHIDGIKLAYIIGSFAKNQLDEHSDIDLLVVGEHDSTEVSKVTVKLGRKFKRQFNAVNMTSDEYKKKQKAGDAFLKGVLNGKLIKVV